MTLNVSKEFTKKYGDVIKTADQVFEKQKDLKILKTVPKLDLALGGGIEEGGWTLITGSPKCGKSSLCLHIAMNAAKEGRPIIYVDVEGRLKKKQLSGIAGIDKYRDKIHQIVPPDDEVWDAETFLTAAEQLVKDPANKGCICIIDSVSSLVTRSDLDHDLSGKIRSGLPKLLSHWMKKMAHVVPKQLASMFLIRHFIADTGPSFKTKVADGGIKIQYQADTIIDVGFTQAWKEGKDSNEEQVGHVINWDIFCSSLGMSGKKAQSWLRYGTGVDIVHEYMMLGEELGLIDRSGAWYSAPFMENYVPKEEWDPKDYKSQGLVKFKDMVLDTEGMYDNLVKEVESMIR